MSLQLTRWVFIVCALILSTFSNAVADKLEKLPIHQKDMEFFQEWHAVKMGETGYFLSEEGLCSLRINAEGAATVSVVHPPSGDANDRLTRAGSSLFYLGDENYCGAYAEDRPMHFELWKSDGTSAGTTLVKKVNCNYPDPDSDAIVGHLSAIGSSVFFDVRHVHITDNEGVIYGEYKEQLWKADGLTNAVYLIKEFGDSDDWYVSAISPVMGSGDAAFFVFRGGLWKTDGSAGNATRITLPGDAEKSVYMHDGQLYFGLLNNNKRELWVTDGSQAGTHLVKVIKAGIQADTSYEKIRFLTSVGNILYFNANDGVHGSELWKTDGTPNGTVMLRDIKPSTYFDDHYWSYIATPEMDNSLFFAPPTDGSYSDKMGIWKTSGVAAGTVFLKDPARQPHQGRIDFGAIYNKEVYFYFYEFMGLDQESREELWKTDGTAAGTVMVKDFAGKWIKERSFIVLGDSMFFWAGAGDGSGYSDLWRLTQSEVTGALPASLLLLLHGEE